MSDMQLQLTAEEIKERWLMCCNVVETQRQAYEYLTTQLQAAEKREKELRGTLEMINQYDSADGTEESILMDIFSLADKALTGSKPIQGENDG